MNSRLLKLKVYINSRYLQQIVTVTLNTVKEDVEVCKNIFVRNNFAQFKRSVVNDRMTQLLTRFLRIKVC